MAQNNNNTEIYNNIYVKKNKTYFDFLLKNNKSECDKEIVNQKSGTLFYFNLHLVKVSFIVQM